jgi:transcriptional antiterminator NusG
MSPPARTGWSTNMEVGQSVSEQFAHEGAPNGESTESDVVDPAVETDDLSASDVESGAGDTDSDENAQSDDAEPVAQGSGDPVADFKADLRSRFGDWFVIHSYAGYENRVKANLETRIQTLNMVDFIFEIEVPWRRSPRSRTARRSRSAASGCPATSSSAWT